MDDKQKQSGGCCCAGTAPQVRIAAQTLKLLFVLNGFAVLAFLSILGFKAPLKLPGDWFGGILCFAFGAVFTLVAHVCAYCFQGCVSRKYGETKGAESKTKDAETSCPMCKGKKNACCPCAALGLSILSAILFVVGVWLVLKGFDADMAHLS